MIRTLLPTLLMRAGLRFYSRHPGQLSLTVAGIALGVAAVVAIDLAAFSSQQAFDATTRLFRGQASHELTRPGGGLPDQALVRLRRDYGVAAAAPVLESRVRLAADPRRSLSLLGIDPLSAARLQAPVLPGGPGAGSTNRLLATPGTAMLAEPVARELGLAVGDRLRLADPAAPGPLELIGLLPGEAGERYLLTDIATAQELLRRTGELSRIDLRLDQAMASRLGAELAQFGWRLQPVAARLAQVDAMTRSFRINLQALSLLAMLVGAFLVFSTVAFAVLRRHEVFGLFRSLGARRAEIFGLVIVETLVLAAAGVLIGLLGGILLGSGLVRLVLRTIGDLYLSASVDYFGVSAAVLLKAALIGFGASLAAALWPALEASRVAPRQAMLRVTLERRRRRTLWPRLWLAAGLAGAATAILWRTSELELAFAGIFMALLAAAVAAPVLVHFAMQALAGKTEWLPLTYAARSVAANLSRTGPAVAALMVAVATFSGVGLMIGSFRLSVDHWLGYSLDADVLIRPQNPVALAAPGEEARLLAELRAIPGVRDLGLSRRVALPDNQGIGALLAVQAAEAGRWPQARADRRQLLAQLASTDTVIVSDAFARKRGVAPGDALTLLARDGPRPYRVLDTFVDYSTDLGLVAMDLSRYRAAFADARLDTIGVFAAGSVEPVLDAVQELAERRGDLNVVTSAWLRELSLMIFDRTFTITQVLRLIAGLVAVIAVVNALQAQRLDGRREFATLRALGLSPGELMRLGELQTLLLGLAAGLLAVPVGLLMAWLLIVVVNRIAFGWSMALVVDWQLLGQGVLLAALAGLAAGWLPNRRALRDPPALALRED